MEPAFLRPPRFDEGLSSTITDPAGSDSVNLNFPFDRWSLSPVTPPADTSHSTNFSRHITYGQTVRPNGRSHSSAPVSPILSSVNGERGDPFNARSPPQNAPPQIAPLALGGYEEPPENDRNASQKARSQSSRPTRDDDAAALAEPGGLGVSLITMLVFFTAGTALAVGHHAYYQSFDKVDILSKDHQMVVAIGVTLAVLSKTALCAVVAVAFTQQLWQTVKQRFLSFRALDSLFSMISDPGAFLNVEIFKATKKLVLLAAIAWTIPIIVMITPASLSIEPGGDPYVVHTPIPRLQYSEQFSSWEAVEGGTDELTFQNFLIGGPSPLLSRLVTMAASSVAVVPMQAPSPGSGYSAFSTSFYGPSYKCEDLDTALQLSNDSINIGNNPYSSLQEAWNQVIGRYIGDTYMFIGAAPEAQPLSHLFFNLNGPGGTNIVCQQWNTSYSVSFQFINGVQHSQLDNTELVSPSDFNFTGIQDVHTTANMELLAYERLHKATKELFLGGLTNRRANGVVHPVSSEWLRAAAPAPSIPLLSTGLIACPELANPSAVDPALCRAGSFPRAIEDLSHNITLSLLSSPALAPINPNKPAPITRAPSSSSSSSNLIYRYSPATLLVPYILAIVAAAVCIAIGTHASYVQGYSVGTSFSRILFATRNPELDHIARARCHPQYQPGGVKLRYGVLRGGGGGAHHTSFPPPPSSYSSASSRCLGFGTVETVRMDRGS